MATIDRNTIKSWFVRGAKPLATQFASWIDSFWHKNDDIPASSIDGLQMLLDQKADAGTTGANKTNELVVDNPSQESVTGNALLQSEINKQVAVRLGNTVPVIDSIPLTEVLTVYDYPALQLSPPSVVIVNSGGDYLFADAITHNIETLRITMNEGLLNSNPVAHITYQKTI